MSKRTNQEIKKSFMEYGVITIPKGTEITNQTAMGLDNNYNFIKDLSWIPLVNGVKQFGLIHDATYRGITIDPKFVEVY